MGNVSANQDQTFDEVEDIELVPIEASRSVVQPIGGISGAQRPSMLPTMRPEGGRSSSPPPIPPAALLRRPPQATQSGIPSLPVPPPPAGRASSTSGVFARVSQTPLPPVVAPIAMPQVDPQTNPHDSVTLRPPATREAQLEVARLRDGLVRTQAEYRALKETLRQRDAVIAELQEALAAQRLLVLETERERDALQSHANTPHDDLKRIRGIGQTFEQKLHAIGVTTYAQIAAWTADDVERTAGELGVPPARIARDSWIERARELER